MAKLSQTEIESQRIAGLKKLANVLRGPAEGALGGISLNRVLWIIGENRLSLIDWAEHEVAKSKEKTALMQ